MSRLYREAAFEPTVPADIPLRRRGLLGGALAGASGLILAPGLLGVVCGCMGENIAPFAPRPAVAAAVKVPLPPRQVRASAADIAEWVRFRTRFIAPEGRVVDTGNGGVSHSEGQGYGLLLAVAHDDRPTFERLLAWTQTNLARADDSLHAWRYDPRRPNPVDDPNNATDGDIFIAWALWRAAFRWSDAGHAALAQRMAADIATLLTADSAAGPLLLPGVTGFAAGGGFDINLSYYCLPALDDLARAAPDPVWDGLRRNGRALLDRACFGTWSLPPDWLRVGQDGAIAPSPGWPARFSYDAVRIPLYIAWAGDRSINSLTNFLQFRSKTTPDTPAWVDLYTDSVAPYHASPGMIAVGDFAAGPPGRCPLSFPSVNSSPDYFSSALVMLSRLAAAEVAA